MVWASHERLLVIGQEDAKEWVERLDLMANGDLQQAWATVASTKWGELTLDGDYLWIRQRRGSGPMQRLNLNDGRVDATAKTGSLTGEEGVATCHHRLLIWDWDSPPPDKPAPAQLFNTTKGAKAGAMDGGEKPTESNLTVYWS